MDKNDVRRIDLQSDLIARCRGNDKRAQLELYRQYAKAMYNVSIHLVRDNFLAEEMMQESFISAFRNIDKYKGEVAFGAWLKKIVINKCLDHLKKKKIEFADISDFQNIQETDEKEDEVFIRKSVDEVFRPGIIMEGGSIEVNGAGSLLTTKACLLNKNRNAGSTSDEIEYYLREYYCTENIIWLNDGVEGDDTDGHIDDIARFVNPDAIVIAVETNKTDKNYGAMNENLNILKKVRLLNGKQPDIIEIPMPEPVYSGNDRLPASYANFYCCNQAVIVPVFGCKNDEIALRILSECFPNRKVEGLFARYVILKKIL